MWHDEFTKAYYRNERERQNRYYHLSQWHRGKKKRRERKRDE
ncbi:hypothetical protein ACE1TF_13085 [Geomicrobium sp. JSM 1781026]|nr:hypothetical protein [Geomicrobium sp. JCM 19037]